MTISRLSEIKDIDDADIHTTGIVGLDRGGYLRKNCPDLIFLGARPGVGKTLLAVQVAYNLSKRGSSILMFSLEMTKEQLRSRLRKTRGFDPSDCDFYICDKSGLHIDEIEDVVEEHIERQGHACDMIVIDYAQIVKAEGRTKAEEVGQIVTKLKRLALKYQIPVFSLVQLNRNIEGREHLSDFVEPSMSDFADSAEIEKWADTALIMHKVPKGKGEVKVSCVKFRHGDKHNFVLMLDRKTVRFTDYDNF